jgi:hypothetical protein
MGEVLEESMEGKPIVITCTQTMNNQEIPKHALIDCGVTGIAFMNQYFARNHQIQLQEHKEHRHVGVIEAKPIESRDIIHLVKLSMEVKDHKEQLLMSITKLGHNPIVVGIL